MPKKATELSPLTFKRLSKVGAHAVGGVNGLYLIINERGAKFWRLRVRVGNKRRDIGLGGFPDVSLAEARNKAKEMHSQIREGKDPLEIKRASKRALIASIEIQKTFKEAATSFISSKSLEWKNPKHKKQWESTLTAYVYPFIGTMQVKDISIEDIKEILEPIWKDKTETAMRVRGRIENVLDWAIAMKLRSEDNPARWKGYLDKILANPNKFKKTVHRTAMPEKEIGVFVSVLQKREDVLSRALEFLILTATRSGEIRGVTWAEIDMDNEIWIIPPKRMKAGKEHRIPLSSRAIDILKNLPRSDKSDYIFRAAEGGMISDKSLSELMNQMGVDAVPHGFRSTFRDWAAEHTDYPNDVAEMALAHTIGNKVEAAYRRGDLFEKRKQMMKDWAAFIQTKC